MSRLDAPLPCLLFRTRARRDLAQEFEAIARDNPQRRRIRAANPKKEIRATEPPSLRRHQRNAMLFAIRELRMFPVKDFKMYLIWYHPLASGDGIEVVRVLHHKRDAQTLLTDDPPTPDES